MLLRLCAAPDADLTAEFANLDDEDWYDLIEQAIPKRVAALLDRSLQRAGCFARLPDSCRKAMVDEKRRLAMSAFGHMISLSDTVTFLKSHNIPAVALKGARLAYRDYPDARLRPLRDLDLLVSAEMAEQAQSLLISSGNYELAPWAEYYGLDFGHQLPELVDRKHGISIEIHHRLNARDWTDEPKLVRMVFEQAEEIELSGTNVQVPSMHANFLHLVEHATLHHMFENGPITLADLHFAAQTGNVDWPVLITQARGMGLERALQLIAALALAHGATWVPQALQQPQADMADHLDVCTAAMLRDESLAEHASMLRGISLRKGQAPGWAAAIRSALTPAPLKLAGLLRVKGDNPLRWLAYPLWLFLRGRAYIAARRAEIDPESAVQEVETLRWLRND
ncbi:MAG: nucleotidyltransferase family protein [Novosphingobium sp.]|uniref:nucleotidyltransferase family protein n=1 Tax=Novosphingobium sp. TaxID=1874826 RepID=UPI003B9D3904